METIRFSHNWNNKLDCKVFTTFRLASRKYEKGNRYFIDHKGEIFIARLLYIRRLYLKDVNEWVARIDTGYSLSEFQDIVRKMYKEKADTSLFYLMLMEKEKDEK